MQLSDLMESGSTTAKKPNGVGVWTDAFSTGMVIKNSEILSKLRCNFTVYPYSHEGDKDVDVSWSVTKERAAAAIKAIVQGYKPLNTYKRMQRAHRKLRDEYTYLNQIMAEDVAYCTNENIKTLDQLQRALTKSGMELGQVSIPDKPKDTYDAKYFQVLQIGMAGVVCTLVCVQNKITYQGTGISYVHDCEWDKNEGFEPFPTQEPDEPVEDYQERLFSSVGYTIARQRAELVVGVQIVAHYNHLYVPMIGRAIAAATDRSWMGKGISKKHEEH